MNGYRVVRILLRLLNSMPGSWQDGVTMSEYVEIATFLIDCNPKLYGDMVEGHERFFDKKTLKKAGY